VASKHLPHCRHELGMCCEFIDHRAYPHTGSDGAGARRWAVWIGPNQILSDSRGNYRRFKNSLTAANAARKYLNTIA